jgi:hypothetical protein
MVPGEVTAVTRTEMIAMMKQHRLMVAEAPQEMIMEPQALVYQE